MTFIEPGSDLETYKCCLHLGRINQGHRTSDVTNNLQERHVLKFFFAQSVKIRLILVEDAQEI